MEKQELQSRLTALNDELNTYLAQHSGIRSNQDRRYLLWLESNKPFHWFVEFYAIVSRGGFCVVIGNPPYLETNQLERDYNLRGFHTFSTGNLYSICSERSLTLLVGSGRMSFIVPLSMFSTPNMTVAQKLMLRSASTLWVSKFSNRPDQLFEGAQNFLSIFILQKRSTQTNAMTTSRLLTTQLQRWASSERDKLFFVMKYQLVDHTTNFPDYAFPKCGYPIELSISHKLFNARQKLSEMCRPSGPSSSWFVFCYGGVYWTKARVFDSPVLKDGKTCRSSADRPAFTIEGFNPLTAISILNSSLHYWFWLNVSDCRNNTYSVMLNFPVHNDKLLAEDSLPRLGEKLMIDYRSNSVRKTRVGKNGETRFEEYYPRLSKAVIDTIDSVLANQYGLSDEEIDFVCSNDIKCRMGQEHDSDEPAQ